jgi:hypothetical protein
MSAKTRHDLSEISKKNICSYIYNNPASMVQIKEATGLSLPYIRLKLINLSNEYMVRESKIPSLGRRMTHYESFSEYTPKEYARKPFLRAYAPLKKLGDDFVLEVLNRLSSQAPKIVAIDMGISLSKVYYVRRYYGNVQ